MLHLIVQVRSSCENRCGTESVGYGEPGLVYVCDVNARAIGNAQSLETQQANRARSDYKRGTVGGDIRKRNGMDRYGYSL